MIMAYITGQTEQGCCLPVKYLGNGTYECEPDVGETHKKHRIFNDYHMFYAKIVGSVGENITIHLKWPQFDPEQVSEEYKQRASYSTDWPSFFPTVKEVLYFSTDEIHWTRIENAQQVEDTVRFSLTLSADTVYVCSTLHYTPVNYRDLVETMKNSPVIQVLNLGKAWDGSDFLTFLATDPDVPAMEKKTVYLQGVQHCHEHTGAHVCDFMLRFLAGDSPAAKALLRKFIFRITPVVDISGWRFGKQTNPLRSGSIDFNYNRDWGIFSLPEVKAIDRYLRECMDNGERLAFLADLHGGTGDENDYTSGAGISFDSRASEPVLVQQRHFVDLVRQNCDYLNPSDQGYDCNPKVDTLFGAYAQQHYGPAYTFEISMSKIWDRAAGRRFPNSQFAYRRLAEQLLQVIGMLLSQP